MKTIITFILLFTITNLMADEKCALTTSDNICVQIIWSETPKVGIKLSNTIRFVDLDQSSDEETVLVNPTQSLIFKAWRIGTNSEFGAESLNTTNTEVGVYHNSNILFPKTAESGVWQFQMQLGEHTFILHEIK